MTIGGFFAGLLALLKALPDFIKLANSIEKRIDEAGIDRKVADDVKTIHETFATKDTAALNALFNQK